MSINKDLLGLDSQDTRRRSHPRIHSPINTPSTRGLDLRLAVSQCLVSSA